MMQITTADARKCLDRARDIDARLKSAIGLVKITAELSNALQPALTRLNRKILIETSSEVDCQDVQGIRAGRLTPTSMFGATSQSNQIRTGISLVALVKSGLAGVSKPADLIAELVAAYVAPGLTPPKEKRRGARPTFAFFTAGLSTLVNRDDLTGDFMRICDCALDETTKLAAAAAFLSDAEILGEIHRGLIAATQAPDRVSTLSRHVVAALHAHRILIEQGCLEPTKLDVKKLAIEILEKKKQNPYGKTQHDRWGEVLIAAGLTLLKPGRESRGKSRNQDY